MAANGSDGIADNDSKNRALGGYFAFVLGPIIGYWPALAGAIGRGDRRIDSRTQDAPRDLCARPVGGCSLTGTRIGVAAAVTTVFLPSGNEVVIV